MRSSQSRVVAALAPLLLLFLLGPTRAADPAPATLNPPAEPGYLAHFRDGDTTLLVINDPLPHLRRLLTSERLRKATRSGKIGELLRKDSPKAPPDPRDGWAFIERNQRWVPQEVALGIGEQGWQDLDHLARAFALLDLCTGSRAAGETAGNELPRLQDELAKELPHVRLPRTRIFVRFREKEDAEALLGMLKLQLDDAGLPPGVKLTNGEGFLTVSATVGDFVPADAMPDVLVDMEIVSDAEDPKAGALSAAAAKLTAEATLEVAGDGLLLTLGPREAGGRKGVRARDLGPELPPARNRNAAGPIADRSDTILWSRWDVRAIKKAAEGWVAMADAWGRSQSARAVADGGEEVMLDTLRILARQLRAIAGVGAMRVWVDAGEGAADASVRLVSREQEAPTAVDLRASSISRLVPADADGFVLDGVLSLADVLSDQLTGVEERMAKQSLRAEFNPDNPRAAAAARMEKAYYERFAAFRTLVHETAQRHFAAPFASVFATRGTVKRIEVQFPLGGAPVPLAAKDLPAIELAVVGQTKDPGAADAPVRFAEELYGALADSIIAAGDGKPRQPGEALLRETELGLGVRTWAFTGAWVTRSFGDGKASVALEGDLRPHLFLVDGLLVFSTSPRLSKSMLAARGDAKKRMTIPADKELAAYGRLTGAGFGRVFEAAGAWFAALGTSLAEKPEQAGEFAQVMGAAGELMVLVDLIEWQTTGPATSRTTHGSLTFAPDPAAGTQK